MVGLCQVDYPAIDRAQRLAAHRLKTTARSKHEKGNGSVLEQQQRSLTPPLSPKIEHDHEPTSMTLTLPSAVSIGQQKGDVPALQLAPVLWVWDSETSQADLCGDQHHSRSICKPPTPPGIRRLHQRISTTVVTTGGIADCHQRRYESRHQRNIEGPGPPQSSTIVRRQHQHVRRVGGSMSLPQTASTSPLLAGFAEERVGPLEGTLRSIDQVSTLSTNRVQLDGMCQI